MARRKNTATDDATKDKQKGTQLVNLLTEVAKTGMYNGVAVAPTRIQAARAALPFLRPTLASIEQTNHEAQEPEDTLIERLRALITQHPGILVALNLQPRMVSVPAEADPKGEERCAEANGAPHMAINGHT